MHKQIYRMFVVFKFNVANQYLVLLILPETVMNEATNFGAFLNAFKTRVPALVFSSEHWHVESFILEPVSALGRWKHRCLSMWLQR